MSSAPCVYRHSHIETESFHNPWWCSPSQTRMVTCSAGGGNWEIFLSSLEIKTSRNPEREGCRWGRVVGTLLLGAILLGVIPCVVAHIVPSHAIVLNCAHGLQMRKLVMTTKPLDWLQPAPMEGSVEVEHWLLHSSNQIQNRCTRPTTLYGSGLA